MGSVVQRRNAVRPLGWLVAACLLLSQVLALPAAFDAFATLAGQEHICRAAPVEAGGSDSSGHHQPHTCCVLCSVVPLPGLVPPTWLPVPPAAARRAGKPPRRARLIDRRRGPGLHHPRAPPL